MFFLVRESVCALNTILQLGHTPLTPPISKYPNTVSTLPTTATATATAQASTSNITPSRQPCVSPSITPPPSEPTSVEAIKVKVFCI